MLSHEVTAGLALESRDMEPCTDDFQLALDAVRDGVVVWDADGRALVTNAAASRLFGLPDGLLRTGARRLDVITFLARRGDYGATEDPDCLARELSDRFAKGSITSLTRRLPDGRYLRADARPACGGRLVVTYQEVQPSEAS
jgi:PAS domain-containing protein